MVDTKPLVLVLGATGRTGKSVIDGLLQSGKYRIAALTRSASASKPEVDALRSRGVEIRIGDYAADPPSKLSEYVEGVNILLSTVSALAIEEQKSILKAAVDAGVKRIIPCDFGTPGGKGVRGLHDSKLDIRDYLKGLTAASNGASAYTFIDIGWWAQLAVPSASTAPSPLGPMGDEYYTEDDKPVLLTDIDRIGPYVARIISDPRTANQYVIIWEDELSFKESRELAEAASGEAQSIRGRRALVGKDALAQRSAESKAAYTKTRSFEAHMVWTFSEYMISIHFLGENSLANAKKLGALDARELYPDIVPKRFADFVKDFYGKGEAH
ncbi:NAD(P)-binding protein [Daedalea quercina L-15889]|uniref:NAD(P)-binding protein n=1 Tax=Daedalea quercina L-15889 TaxID=1314783 RepID=A0A165MUR7_9APHY|nr:NAD(P)-binding protein [Daedalea quercina L-15889]